MTKEEIEEMEANALLSTLTTSPTTDLKTPSSKDRIK